MPRAANKAASATRERSVETAPQHGHAPANYTPENIAGKAAVVTGGTTGIGRAIARLLAERGARVLIFGRDRDDLNEALEEIKATGGEVYGLTADQSKTRDVLKIFQAADSKLGGVDILVNNAAVHGKSAADIDHDEIAYVVNANVVGYMSCAHEAIASMREQGGGHVVNVGSLSAEAREEEADVYVATKAAIEAFSASLRKTVNPQGVKVSLIEPGLVESSMTSAGKDPKREIKKQKMLEAVDIAEAVHYCLTQPARCDVIMVQIRPHLQPL